MKTNARVSAVTLMLWCRLLPIDSNLFTEGFHPGIAQSVAA